MKKITMILTGVLFACTVSMNAQSDSARQSRPSDLPVNQSADPTVTPQQSQYRTADRVAVPADQVPSSLRQTLQGTQYKGWERTPLYQDKRSQEYYFELPDANGTTKRMYRFDRNGKAISGSNLSTLPDDNSPATPQGQPADSRQKERQDRP